MVGVSLGRKIFVSVSFWKVLFDIKIMEDGNEDLLLTYFSVIVNIVIVDVSIEKLFGDNLENLVRSN